MSTLSETLRQPGVLHSGSKVGGSRLQGSFSNQSKGSIHSQHQTTRHDGDAAHLDLKRRSQLINKQQQRVLIDEQNIQIRDPQLVPPPSMNKANQPPGLHPSR